MPASPRRFAFQVGPVLALLGAASVWRGHDAGAWLAAFGVLVVVSGVAAPGLLTPLQRGWMALGTVLHRVVSPVVVAILYLVVVTPVGLLRRTFGRSPLARSNAAASFWLPRRDNGTDSPAERRERMRHPY